MEAVNRPVFSVIYAGKDITQDISAHLVSLAYSDRTEGESDEVEITLEDSEGKWKSDWYPAKGDKIEVSLGYEGQVLNCGTFTVDEIEISGPPDTLMIRALAAGINSPLRTKRSQAHEDQTLRQIAEAVASRQGLTIEDGTASTTQVRINFDSERSELAAAASAGRSALAVQTVDAYRAVVREHHPKLLAAADSLSLKGRSSEAVEIRQTIASWQAAWAHNALPEFQTSRAIVLTFCDRLDVIASTLKNVDTTVTRSKLDQQVGRATQDREDDLAFLRRIAAMYGVLFSVRGDMLVFTSRYDIEGAGGVMTISRGDLIRYSMREKSVKTYAKATVAYHEPSQKKDIISEFLSENLPDFLSEAVSGDTLLINQRVESEAQAQEIAKASLYDANSNTTEASIDLPGRPMLMAGINIILTDLGRMSGKWHVKESSHRYDKSGGYVTTAELKRVGK